MLRVASASTTIKRILLHAPRPVNTPNRSCWNGGKDKRFRLPRRFPHNRLASCRPNGRAIVEVRSVRLVGNGASSRCRPAFIRITKPGGLLNQLAKWRSSGDIHPALKITNFVRRISTLDDQNGSPRGNRTHARHQSSAHGL